MRLARLNLARYGRFTGHVVELPARSPDFHIIFGPNEAGKSTALAAIENWLFGIPSQSPYSFFHSYSEMRVGGMVEKGGDSLEALRRKGNKDTLLSPDGIPIREGHLGEYLAGVDRDFFLRMFSLDHSRIEQGARDILDASEDADSILFAAGEGFRGLPALLSQLSDEADRLWSPRRAQYRKFYSVADKLKQAQKELREQTLSASKWQELKSACENAQEAYAEVDRKMQEQAAKFSRLSRIGRVFADIQKARELTSLIEELGSVIELPENSKYELDEIEPKDAKLAAQIDTLAKQRAQVQSDLGELNFDKTIVQHAEDIEQLHERRIEIRREKKDLPKREAELKTEEGRLRACARELGWNEAEASRLIERIPAVSKVRAVRELLNQKGVLGTETENARQRQQESCELLAKIKKQLDDLGNPSDVAGLEIAIKNAKEQGDLMGRVRIAERALLDKQQGLELRLASLAPSIRDERSLVNAAVPARAEVMRFGEREEYIEKSLLETQGQIESEELKLQATRAALEEKASHKKIATFEELTEMRGRRDRLWSLVKMKHVQNESLPIHEADEFDKELQDLPGALELTLSEADRLADERFDHAEEVGRIAEMNRTAAKLEIQLDRLQEKEKRFAEERARLQADWEAMWHAAPVHPLSAKAMLEWLDERAEALQLMDARAQVENELNSARNEMDLAKQKILAEMSAIGVDKASFENESLSIVVEYASNECRQQKTAADKKAELEDNARSAASDVKQRERKLQQAERNMADWASKWTEALSGIGVAADTLPEVAGTHIDTIDQMRETASRIRSLQHERIEKIKRDIVDFECAVDNLAKKVAADLLSRSAADAAVEIENRLQNALKIQEEQQKKLHQSRDLAEQIDGLKSERRQLQDSISHLMRAAGAKNRKKLRKVIERSDRHRSLQSELQQVFERIQQNGDGMPLTDLEAECNGISIDEIAAQGQSSQRELDDLKHELSAAAVKRSEARRMLQAVGGEDAAAKAAASAEEYLAEMQGVADQYVQAKTAASLLKWVIERYRREKQAPLLNRAGELFKIITDGSFASLQVEFDAKDNPYLVGIRPAGGRVPIAGMSTGTADQLYLALRIGAVELYLDQRDAMPFVADDLFVSFDDKRAAAGLRLLEKLGQKTQILFFTHHQHLIELARQSLNEPFNLVTLA